jgi:hypothetical protein
VVDPATNGLACNGGLAAGGGVCACGWCVVPLDGCPCGCAGDPECVRCSAAADGTCETYNQGLSCNGGAGICDGEWCVDAPPCLEVPEFCSSGAQCCSGYCINGMCAAGCSAVDGFCNIPEHCCDALCVTTGLCGCRDVTEACNVDSDCCNNRCHNLVCVNCKPPGGTCNEPGDCCSFSCSGGVCLAP